MSKAAGSYVSLIGDSGEALNALSQATFFLKKADAILNDSTLLQDWFGTTDAARDLVGNAQSFVDRTRNRLPHDLPLTEGDKLSVSAALVQSEEALNLVDKSINDPADQLSSVFQAGIRSSLNAATSVATGIIKPVIGATWPWLVGVGLVLLLVVFVNGKARA